MAAGPFGFGRLWPVSPGGPVDEATPVGLAPGQMPVDPRRDGSVQPTVAGKNLSRAAGVVAGGMAQGLLDAARLPGDVYAGRVDPMSDEGRQRAFDLAGTLATGGMPMGEAGAAGIFGGRLARGADHEALKRAESMAAWGEPRRDIWEDTGWFQGPDRQWRFEIPDDKARLTSSARGEFEAPGGVTTGELSQQFAHRDLINNYPDAGKIRLDVYKAASKDPNYSEGGYGSVTKGSDQKVIWGQASTPEAARNFTLHELQHHIQDREGFARGASPERFTREEWAQEQMAPHQAAVRDLAGRYPEAEAAVRLRDDTRAGLERDFGADWRKKAPADRLDALDEAEAGISLTAGAPDLAAARAAHDKRRSFVDDDYMAGLSVPLWQQKQYHRTAGEVEARNVETRRNMTPDERRATPPWETQDLPDAEQVIFRQPPTGVPQPPRSAPPGFGGSEIAVPRPAPMAAPADLGSFNITDELASLLSGYTSARGLAGMIGAGGAAAAALSPGDAQAAPSPSGASPMAFGFGSLPGLPTDVLLRQRQGMPEPLTLGDPAAMMLGPDQAPAPGPGGVQPQAEPQAVTPLSFGALAPRMPAAGSMGMGFGPGSPGAGLPLPPQEPDTTGSPTPAAAAPRAAAVAPAASSAMRTAPLPPARPPEFGSSADRPSEATTPAPAPAPASPSEPSTWDRVSQFLGGNADMLIGIGTGLMSTPGWGRGLAAGVQNGVAMQQASAAKGLAQAKQAVETSKLMQGQRNTNLTAQAIARDLKIPYEDALARASNPEFVNAYLKRGLPPEEVYQQRTDPSGNVWNYNTKTGQAQVALQAKDDKGVALIPDAERANLGLPAGSYQRDANGKISAVNPTGTTINMGAEKAQDATVGKGYGEYQLELAKEGRNGASTLNTLALMEQAMGRPDFYSGVGGEAIKRANQALTALGVKDARASSPSEVFDALSNKVVLDGLGGSLGPGISNTDRDYIGRTAPNLTQSVQGNRDLIGIARALAERKQAVAKLARDYAGRNGGRLDAGFDQALDDFAQANPLFPKAAAAASAPAPQEAPRGLPQGARQAGDGRWYVSDPNRPGKYLEVR